MLSPSTRPTSIARTTSCAASPPICSPNRLRRSGAGEAIRIWSVPCSTGEEPYSIAIWLLENWPLVDRYEIEIVGSDIDTGVLEARAAECSANAR